MRDCLLCATWVCSACGWKRQRANPGYEDHTCNRCGSAEGTIRPTRHGETMWWSHNNPDELEAVRASRAE